MVYVLWVAQFGYGFLLRPHIYTKRNGNWNGCIPQYNHFNCELKCLAFHIDHLQFDIDAMQT